MATDLSPAEARINGRIGLFAATSGHSGVDRVFRNLVQQFDAWGVGVDVLRIRGHGPEIDVHPLSHARSVDLGVAHVNTALPALVRWLRRTRPRALLTDKDRVNRLALLARAIARTDTRLAVRLGTTVSVNLADRGRLERWTQRASMRHLYPRADAVIVPSLGVADDLAAVSGLDRGHIQVVRSPIVSTDIEALAARPIAHPWLAPGQPPVVLGVGELGFRKDFETLLRAFARLRRRRPCRLIILGRGRREAALREQADALGIATDLDLPGFEPNPYVFLSRAALFVLSSRWEGMPVALIEALACGTPAVATDCPSGPAELLGDGRCGALVPVGDDAAMAAAMENWIGRRPEPAALARAVAPYGIAASAEAYLRVLTGSAHHGGQRP